MRTDLFLICILFCTSQFVSAQLSGTIEDIDTRERMEYATAALFNEFDSTLVTGVISDETGLFNIENIRRGNYYLEVSFVGYQLKTISNIQINSRGEAKDLGSIKLTISNQLNEVVVRGDAATVVNKIDRQVFDAKKFQNAQGGTATDLVKNLPSISVDGLGAISVRGSSGFVVLLNGKPVQGNATTLLNQLPANAIERVEVVTAPSAKYDPEGKAGILNIITKKGATNGTFAQVNVKAGLPSIEDYDNAEYAQRYGVDATYNIRSDQWNISLGANYQRNDLAGRREGDVFTIVDDRKTQLPSDGERSFDEVNYSGRFTVDFTPDSTNTYSLGFYAGKRSKDRTADILYNDNNAISPVNGGNRLYTFQYFNENLRIRRGDFVLGSFDYAHDFKNGSKLSTSFLYEYTLLGGPTTNLNLGFPNTSEVLQDEFNTNDNPLNGIRFQVDYALKELPFGKIETGYQY
ncbi:MAG: TonB-dependent receptor plug domain-containing protein, partial [Maribacter sp.]